MRDLTRPDMNLPNAGRSSFLTYEPYYGLKEKPFSLSADPRFLYKSAAHAPTFEALRAGIRRREGLIVLTGEPGTGKTTLCRSVLEALDRKTFCTMVPDPFVSREDLLKMLLLDFGVMSVDDLRSGRLQGATRPELSYPLYDFLRSLVPLQAYAVLILDEAQNLSPQLLEELRILSDLEAPEKLLQLVLVGQPELRAKLKDHSMRQLDQRVSVRAELTGLDRAGVGEYIAHRLNVAGAGTDRVTFSDEAVDAIFKAAQGNPRLINLTCDKALHHGHLARTFTIGADIVKRSLAELGMTEPAAAAAASPVPTPSPSHAPTAVPAPAPSHVSTAVPAPAPSHAPTPVPAPAPAAPASEHVTGGRTAPSAPITPTVASTPLTPIGGVRAAGGRAPIAPLPEENASDAADDFGLTDKFFERGPATVDLSTDADDAGPQMFMSANADLPPTSRRRTFLLVLLCILAPALAAWMIWMWQQPVGSGALPSAPTQPVQEQPQQRQQEQPTATPLPTSSGQAAAAAPVDPIAQPYEVGVALFDGYDRASGLAMSLAASGFRATTREIESPKGRLFEVRTGPYLSRDAAEADAAIIRKMPGYADARVVTPQPTTP
jgi:general secretion pathway protein A